MSPTPTPAPDPLCTDMVSGNAVPCPIPGDIGTVGDIAGDHVPTSPSGIDQAMDQLQHLPAPSEADAAHLHALIYGQPAGLTAGQITALITITAILLGLVALIGWTVHRTRGGAR